MTADVESVPVVGRAYRLGVNPVTTTLVLLGPVLIVLVGLVGRNPLTVGLAIAYVLSVPGSVAYFWNTAGEADEHARESNDDGTENDDPDGKDE